MLSLRPMHLLLPGIFLFLLGLGNIGVGIYKSNQYERVIVELSELPEDQTAAILLQATPLKRIQLAQKKQARVIHLQKKARAKKDFYHFFVIGGIVFMLLSFIMFYLSIALRFKQGPQKSKNALD